MTKLKMKKLALAAGLALAGTGMVPSAQAVNLATDGLGQVLVFPYYTTRAGWNTLINITNTSNQVVVAKVRFQEGYNSRDILDFNVILSPFDVWNGTVSANGEMTHFATSDTSCTVPQIPAGGIDFHDGTRTFGMQSYTGANADSGPQTADRMREGYATVIMMGTAPADYTDLSRAAIHVNGVPRNCALLRDAFTLKLGGGYNELVNSFPFYAVNPLKGTFSLVNAENGWNASGEATTLAHFSTQPIITAQLNPSGTVPYISSYHEPDLGSGNRQGSVLTANGSVVNYGPADSNAGGGDNRVESVSGVLGRSSVVNQWANLASPPGAWNVQSDWVVTFPTKRFYVDGATHEFGGRTPGRRGKPVTFPAPFGNLFGNGQSCDDVTYTIYNREEGQLISTTEPPFSPAPSPQGNQICQEVNILTFGAAANATVTNVLRSPMGLKTLSANVGNLPGNNGWMQLNFANPAGWLPVTGFAVINRTNPNGGLNEAFIVDHAYIRQ